MKQTIQINQNMPIELSKIIQNFARPMTRINWRQGGSFPSRMFFEGLHTINDINLYRYFIEIEEEFIFNSIYERAIELGIM